MGLTEHITRPIGLDKLIKSRPSVGGSVTVSYAIKLGQLYNNLEAYITRYTDIFHKAITRYRYLIGKDSIEELKREFDLPVFVHGRYTKQELKEQIKDAPEEIKAVINHYLENYKDNEEFAVFSMVDKDKRLYLSVILRNGAFNKALIYWIARKEETN